MIAVVLDGKFRVDRACARDARGAQRCRPHQRAGLRRPDLDGDAEQRDTRGRRLASDIEARTFKT